MKQTTRVAIPEPILRLQKQLDEIRASHRARTKLPDSMWYAATELARQYGVYAVAHPLRLDHTGLSRRVHPGPPALKSLSKPQPMANALVELSRLAREPVNRQDPRPGLRPRRQPPPRTYGQRRTHPRRRFWPRLPLRGVGSGQQPLWPVWNDRGQITFGNHDGLRPSLHGPMTVESRYATWVETASAPRYEVLDLCRERHHPEPDVPNRLERSLQD